MARLEIPIENPPQSFTVGLSGVLYSMRVYYAETPLGGWYLDIGDGFGKALANGLALVPGANILSQYAYLDMKGALYVVNDNAKGDMPPWGAFPKNAHLVWVETE
jgi:hypothetical protein